MASPRPEPHPPRYSDRPFPPYRFVPGETPHPHRDPEGYAHGEPAAAIGDWSATEWGDLEPWLYAVDLFNHGYWWACHEVLEALWHAAGRSTRRARFVQGILQVAAAYLNRSRGHHAAAPAQAERALRRIERAAGSRVTMGVDVPDFSRRVERSFASPASSPARIVLEPRPGD